MLLIYITASGVDLARGKWWIGLRDTTEPSVEEAPRGSQPRTEAQDRSVRGRKHVRISVAIYFWAGTARKIVSRKAFVLRAVAELGNAGGMEKENRRSGFFFPGFTFPGHGFLVKNLKDLCAGGRIR
jgi:hypothetical protein